MRCMHIDPHGFVSCSNTSLGALGALIGLLGGLSLAAHLEALAKGAGHLLGCTLGCQALGLGTLACLKLFGGRHLYGGLVGLGDEGLIYLGLGLRERSIVYIGHIALDRRHLGVLVRLGMALRQQGVAQHHGDAALLLLQGSTQLDHQEQQHHEGMRHYGYYQTLYLILSHFQVYLFLSGRRVANTILNWFSLAMFNTLTISR